jgi:hypothetical protein
MINTLRPPGILIPAGKIQRCHQLNNINSIPDLKYQVKIILTLITKFSYTAQNNNEEITES